jgi:ankyrin repeat protein
MPMTDREQFLEAACVPLDGAPHGSGDLARADAILAAHPEIAGCDVFTAVVLGDDVAVRRFVEADAAAATRAGGLHGWDPLTHLCFSRYLRDPARAEGFVRCARLLLAQGASASTGFYAQDHEPAPTFESALYGAAAVARHVELTRLLLLHGADPNDDETPYHVPETYDNAVMEVLVESGRLGKAAMTTMVARKHDWHDYDGIAWLLAHGADPNEISAWGRRALHQALERDNPLCFAELLLDHGADPRLANAAGRSAVAVAARAGRSDVLELFSQRGFDVVLQGTDALLAACARADRATARALVERDPGLVRAIEAEEPGTLAAFAGAASTDGLALLLDLGFDPALRTRRAGARDDTALHAAIWRGRLDAVRLLLARGVALEAKNGHGETPLAYAARVVVDPDWTRPHALEVIDALLAAGADPSAVTVPTGSDAVDARLARPVD